MQVDQPNGSTAVPVGTLSRARDLSAIGEVSGCGLCDPYERGVIPENYVHHDRELSGYSNGSAFESDAPFEFQPPYPQVTIRKAAGQNNRRRLIEKASDMTVAAPGYV